MGLALVGLSILASVPVAYLIAGFVFFAPNSAAYESIASRSVGGGKAEHELRLTGPSPRMWFFASDFKWPRLLRLLTPWTRCWLLAQMGHFPPTRKVVIPEPVDNGRRPSKSAVNWHYRFHVSWSMARR